MKKMTLLCATMMAAALTGMTACEEKAPPPQPAQPSPKATPTAATPPVNTATPAAAPSAAASGATVGVLGLKFSVPQGWRQVPPANSMRLAEIQVPDASGDAAKSCTIAFSSAGGTVESNLDRWSGQIHDAMGNPVKGAVVKSQVAGNAASTIELEGVYAGMGDGQPKSNWMLRGTIIDTPEGLLFVKMTGPAEQMKAAGAAYKAMLEGVKK